MMAGRNSRAARDTFWLIRQDCCRALVVHKATIQDREGVQPLLEPLTGTFPRLEKVWVDQAYTGKGRTWIKEQMGWEVEIARHAWSGLRGIWARHPMRSSIGTRSFRRAFMSFPTDG
jgi:putative transposase